MFNFCHIQKSLMDFFMNILIITPCTFRFFSDFDIVDCFVEVHVSELSNFRNTVVSPIQIYFSVVRILTGS